MACGTSGSLYDFAGNKIEDTFGRVAQIIPAADSVNSDRSVTPQLYDGRGNLITGIKFQEAFDRDAQGNVQPTEGPFVDAFWEEDADGNKMPKDIKWWVDSNFNLTPIPQNQENFYIEYKGKVVDSALVLKRQLVSSSVQLTSEDYHVGVDSTPSSLTITLPSSYDVADQEFSIKDEGFYFHINPVTIVSEDSRDRFEDGESSLILNRKGIALNIYSNGNGKYFIK